MSIFFVQDLETTLKVEEDRLAKALKETGQKFPDLFTQRLQERVNKLQKLHMTRVKLPDQIFVVSCAETLSGTDIFLTHSIVTLTIGFGKNML